MIGKTEKESGLKTNLYLSMKSIFTIILVITVLSISAQKGVIVKYFDSTLFPCSKEKAFFSAKLTKIDNVYKGIITYSDSNTLYSIANYKDTFLASGFGTIVTHYRSGKVKDSSFTGSKGVYGSNIGFYESGKIRDSTFRDPLTKENDVHYYYESGKLKGHSYWNNIEQRKIDEFFDENGNRMENYIYERDVSFPDGMRGWVKFLERNLNSSVPSEKGARSGKYIVYLSLSFDEEGNLKEAIAENNPGYGTMEEALRVIKKSPKWIHAIKENKPVANHKRQVITFVVGY